MARLWGASWLAVMISLAAGCARGPQCPAGMAPDETRAGPGVWCRSTDGAQLRWTEFHADGTAKRQSCGYAAGVPEGTFLAWHSNGKTWVQGQYTSGRKAGRWTQWDAFGAKVAEGEYRAGEFVAGAPVGVIAGCETRKP